MYGVMRHAVCALLVSILCCVPVASLSQHAVENPSLPVGKQLANAKNPSGNDSCSLDWVRGTWESGEFVAHGSACSAGTPAGIA